MKSNKFIFITHYFNIVSFVLAIILLVCFAINTNNPKFITLLFIITLIAYLFGTNYILVFKRKVSIKTRLHIIKIDIKDIKQIHLFEKQNILYCNITDIKEQEHMIKLAFYTNKQITHFISYIGEALFQKTTIPALKSYKTYISFFLLKNTLKVALTVLLAISYVNDYIIMPYKRIDNAAYLDGSYTKMRFFHDTGIIPSPNEIIDYSALSFYYCLYGNSYLRYLLNPYSLSNNFCLEIKYKTEDYERNRNDVLNKFNYLNEPVQAPGSQDEWRMPISEEHLGKYVIKIVFFKIFENETYHPDIISFIAYNDSDNIIRYCLQNTMGRDYYTSKNEFICEIKNGFLLPWD